jgi:transcription-repair coupling factor (superfamily II helicase)
MNAFYDGKYDVLLSTTIVESGLDIPNANTMIVHRADMFGLAQLYQLRGRVGARSARLCLFTTPPGKKLTTRRSAARRCCNRSTRWVPASSSPATTSTSAAPAICWARSSPAISAKSASSSTSRCSRRPSLLNTVALKLLCRDAQVEKIDAGEKAVVFTFHDNKFARPDRLIGWIQKNAPLVKVRPDQRVIVQRVWKDERQRLSGVTSIVSSLAKLAA